MSGEKAAAGIGGILGMRCSIAVTMIGQGGIVDRFYYSVVEIALNDTKVKVNDIEHWKV